MNLAPASERTFLGSHEAHTAAFYDNLRIRRIERNMARVRWWSGQVDSFGERVDAFAAQVDASAARIDAVLTDYRRI